MGWSVMIHLAHLCEELVQLVERLAALHILHQQVHRHVCGHRLQRLKQAPEGRQRQGRRKGQGGICPAACWYVQEDAAKEQSRST